ncbi:luciferase family protein [Halosolutus gelatinilyticus]|uniref:luciferase domain-containing protein n=1 Tax=Halosolutus gelatinilyticus TaxID=2931975 RepID=UPI001FF35A4B|nr:luciferase family protein [Halosolutus gelatinilyticus]
MNRIESAVSDWPGVEVRPHDRGGGHEFVLDGREIGHVHGDRLADIPFAKRLRDVLLEEGRAEKHHVVPDSGWISYYIRSDDDVDGALWLLRLSYLYQLVLLRKRTGDSLEKDGIDVDAELAELDTSDDVYRTFDALRTAG